MLLPKQQFDHWLIVKLLNRSGVWETFLAGTQGTYTTHFTSETVTFYIPALDDFFHCNGNTFFFMSALNNLKPQLMEQPTQQIFDPTKWYTLQIHLNYHYDDKTQQQKEPPIEFKDMSADQIINTRRIIWQQGIIVNLSPIAWELIDPLKIRVVYVLQQPSKFGV